MSEIDWCLKQRSGIRFVESSENLVKAYLKMAEDSMGTMNREKDKNIVFGVSACYYSMYYSLYAVLQIVGIKCEIHSCSIDFMREVLRDYYDVGDVKLIELAFSVRNDLQYYVNRAVRKEDIERILSGAYDFYVKSRDIVAGLTEKKIKEIRREFEDE